MTDLLAQLGEMLKWSTDGPLGVSVWGMSNGTPEEWVITGQHGVIAHVYREGDAELWAAMRNALPAMLRVCEAARKLQPWFAHYVGCPEAEGAFNSGYMADMARLSDALAALSGQHGEGKNG